MWSNWASKDLLRWKRTNRFKSYCIKHFYSPRKSSDFDTRQFYYDIRIKCPKTGVVRRDGHVPPVTSRSAVRKSRGFPSRISVSGIRQSQENATPRGDAAWADRGGRMLTARSGPLGLGVPRTLGPAEGSDHLFLLPERALIMDSTHLRQDLAGLDFNLHLNLLHTAPRGNVWLCELSTGVKMRSFFRFSVLAELTLFSIFFLFFCLKR